MANTPENLIYEFDCYRLDIAHLMLYRGDEELSLAPKAVMTLLILIERRGQIVPREELIQEIWRDAIVEDANLTQYIHVLRKTLGESSNGVPLIETLRRRGYRFNGEVSSVSRSSAETSVDVHANLSAGDVSRPKRWRRAFAAVAIALPVVLLVIGAAFWRARKIDKPNAFAGVKLTRLTRDQNAIQPSISPDGKMIVYALEEKSSTRSLWLKNLANGETVRIMPEGNYLDTVFSADGRRILYLTPDPSGPNSALVSIPVSGGEPTTIARNVVGSPAVSVDGRRIAVFKLDLGLTVIDATGENAVPIESIAPKFNPIIWSSKISFSPDGERIALCGKDDAGKSRILDVSVASRAVAYLTIPEFSDVDDVVWLPDGSGVLVTAKEKPGEPFQIWRVSVPSGEARRVTSDFNDYDWISLSADAKTVVANRNVTTANIWVAPLDDATRANKVTLGADAQDGYRGLVFAGDKGIVFTSPRSGNVDLWRMNPDGSDQSPMTAGQGSLNTSPRMTSDGRYIVFVSTRPSGAPHVWRMDVDGRNPVQLTDDPSGQTYFDVTADGRTVVYATPNDAKVMTTRKVSIDGGESTALADDYQTSGVIAASPDGKLMLRYLYLRGQQRPWCFGIFPVEGGEPIKLIELPAFRNLVRWSPDGKSFLYVKTQTAQIWRQPLDASDAELVFDFKTGLIFNFAIAPKSGELAFSHGTQFNEVILIEDLD